MKPTIFTSKEKELIRKTLLLRKESYQKHEVPLRLKKNIEDTLEKINSDFDNYFLKNHNTQITSCINEFITPFEERIEFYFKLPSINFTKLTNTEKEEIELFDLCFSILEKTGYRKSKTRFLKIFEKIEKLKNSEIICISRNDEKNVYKVAFINHDETMEWAINSEVNLLYKDFIIHSKTKIESFLDSFSETVSKNEARNIITNSVPVVKNDNTLELTKYLLT